MERQYYWWYYVIFAVVSLLFLVLIVYLFWRMRHNHTQNAYDREMARLQREEFQRRERARARADFQQRISQERGEQAQNA